MSLTTHAQACFEAEVLDELSGKSADLFQPAPQTWKQVFGLLEHIRTHWIDSFRKELKILLKMETFAVEEPNKTNVIISVTVKFRVKLRADGNIDKLKSRVCLRGDQQGELVDWDTWCPIAGFRALRIFLAFASQSKCRVYQLDFIGASLQPSARNRTFTTLPADWARFFPEMATWFGKPLRLKKSLYGAVDASRNWDDELDAWLQHPTQAFSRCPAEGSIYFRFYHDDFLFLLNAVDDLLYFSNSSALRAKFEQDLTARFDVDLIGQAHWYLQSRVSQNADFSIGLDQARYSSLILSRFIPSLSLTSISDADRKQYDAPLPA